MALRAAWKASQTASAAHRRKVSSWPQHPPTRNVNPSMATGISHAAIIARLYVGCKCVVRTRSFGFLPVVRHCVGASPTPKTERHCNRGIVQETGGIATNVSLALQRRTHLPRYILCVGRSSFDDR